MRVINCKKEKYTHFIGRPSPLGNPFIIGRDGTREQVVIKFKHYAVNNSEIMELIRQLPENAVLGCFCAPQDCHGYAIKEIWEELNVSV